MDIFKQKIIEFLKENTPLENIELEVPPNPDMGDYAFPCFGLAKELKKNPVEIAKDLASKFESNNQINEVKSIGPYLNFFVNKGSLTQKTLDEILQNKEKYGSTNLGKNKKILLEHTSINPNASPHVGRARNALIGDSVVRILRFQGYKVEVHYLVNDVGKQIAMLILGSEGKKNIKFGDLLKIYIDINQQLENNPELENKALELLNKLEKGDQKIRKRFRQIVDICIKGQSKLFSDLGIKYDFFDYESDYLWSKKTDDVIKLLEKTGKLFIDGHNRWVLNQEGYGLGVRVPILVLTRGDGTSLYTLRDIAYAIEMSKKGTYHIVLGEDQKLYNEQINSVLFELRIPKRKAVYYSFVLLQEGKMSTRKGNLVLLEDFMNESVKKANDEIQKRYNKHNNKSAKVIGYGALKYSILKVSATKSVIFNWKHALSFEGDSGPYLQYAYARICSILKKNRINITNPDSKLIDGKLEIGLIKHLSEYPNLLKKAAEDREPHLIATYLYVLAQKFNEFYHAYPVLKEEKHLRNARLGLIKCVNHVLKSGLHLLGIDVLEKM